MKVHTTPEVKLYLNDLISILFEKEYFGFEDSAHKYVDDLIDEIENNLSLKPHKPAPKYFDRYGKNMYYASFRKNKQTVWYAFFTKYQDENNEIIYLIRYISNNHMDAQRLVSSV